MAKPQRTTSPAFQFYPKDFLSSSKVMRMSLTERGVYITLLSLDWLDNGVPDDVAELARLVGVKRGQFERMWSGPLHECFSKGSDGRLHNDRLNAERKKQAEYRRRQTDAAASRWEKKRHCSGNATALLEQQSHRNALRSPVSNLQSTSSDQRERQGGAPLHTTHKKHASCGRVCVPADLHNRFIRALNTDDADQTLRDWYLAVDNEWTTGIRQQQVISVDDYTFWRARFAEKWPSTETPKPAGKWDSWQPKRVTR